MIGGHGCSARIGGRGEPVVVIGRNERRLCGSERRKVPLRRRRRDLHRAVVRLRGAVWSSSAGGHGWSSDRGLAFAYENDLWEVLEIRRTIWGLGGNREDVSESKWCRVFGERNGICEREREKGSWGKANWGAREERAENEGRREFLVSDRCGGKHSVKYKCTFL